MQFIWVNRFTFGAQRSWSNLFSCSITSFKQTFFWSCIVIYPSSSAHGKSHLKCCTDRKKTMKRFLALFGESVTRDPWSKRISKRGCVSLQKSCLYLLRKPSNSRGLDFRNYSSSTPIILPPFRHGYFRKRWYLPISQKGLNIVSHPTRSWNIW